MTDPQTLPDHNCCWPDCERESLTSHAPLCLAHLGEAWDLVERIRNGGASEPLNPTKASKASQQAARRQSRAEQSRDAPGGWVYYAQVGDQIKIGHARDVKRRLKNYPPGTKLLAVEPGSRSAERSRHIQFAHALAAGREWFQPTHLLLDHIEHLRANYGDVSDMEHRYRTHAPTLKVKGRWSAV